MLITYFTSELFVPGILTLCVRIIFSVLNISIFSAVNISYQLTLCFSTLEIFLGIRRSQHFLQVKSLFLFARRFVVLTHDILFLFISKLSFSVLDILTFCVYRIFLYKLTLCLSVLDILTFCVRNIFIPFVSLC